MKNSSAKTKIPSVKRALFFARPHLWLIGLSLLCALIYVGAQLLAPVFIGWAINNITAAGAVNMDKILYYTVYLMITISCAVLFQFLSAFFASIASHRTIEDIRVTAFNKLNRLPLKTIDKINHGDMITRVTADAQRVSDGLIQGLTQLFAGTATILGTIVFMLSINVFVALAVIGLTPISIFVAFLIAKSGQKMFSSQIKHEGQLSGISEEYISNQRIVKLFNYEQTAAEKFEQTNQKIKKFGTKAVFISAIVNPSTRLVNGFVYAVVCVVSSLLIIKTGSLNVGGLSTFLIYTLQYAKPFNEITGIVTEIQAALISSNRLFEMIDFIPEPLECDLPKLPLVDGGLSFKDVSFSYTDKPFIKGINLDIIKGKHVAVVGKTGCGKTTLLSLIMRFYDIDSGQILADGIDTSSVTKASLRKNIGMVLQDTWLFKGTVKQNIAYGKQNATDDEIKEACKNARIDGFIEKLKDGYDTVLEPYSLSQGQTQLFNIARVFLARPPIIILDEATSNIDAHTESKIQEALKEITEGHTSFIVAHRLSTIRSADLILVMDNGKIIEQGTHAQLTAKDGHYNKLLNAPKAP